MKEAKGAPESTRQGPTLRKTTWRQETPRDQLVVLLGSLEGNLLNLQDGGARDPATTLKVMLDQVRDAQAIVSGHVLKSETWREGK